MPFVSLNTFRPLRSVNKPHSFRRGEERIRSSSCCEARCDKARGAKTIPPLSTGSQRCAESEADRRTPPVPGAPNIENGTRPAKRVESDKRSHRPGGAHNEKTKNGIRVAAGRSRSCFVTFWTSSCTAAAERYGSHSESADPVWRAACLELSLELARGTPRSQRANIETVSLRACDISAVNISLMMKENQYG